MNRKEAEEILKKVNDPNSTDWRMEEFLHAKNFLEGFNYERERAEKLVVAFEKIEKIKSDERVHAKFELAYCIVREALSEYRKGE